MVKVLVLVFLGAVNFFVLVTLFALELTLSNAIQWVPVIIVVIKLRLKKPMTVQVVNSYKSGKAIIVPQMVSLN